MRLLRTKATKHKIEGVNEESVIKSLQTVEALGLGLSNQYLVFPGSPMPELVHQENIFSASITLSGRPTSTKSSPL